MPEKIKLDLSLAQLSPSLFISASQHNTTPNLIFRSVQRFLETLNSGALNMIVQVLPPENIMNSEVVCKFEWEERG